MMRFKSSSLPFVLWLAAMCVGAQAQTGAPSVTPAQTADKLPPQSTQEREVIELSRQKWLWMAARDTEALDRLIDANAIFVHMGATMDKAQEIDVIKSGRIEYKQADIQEISARTIGDTVIVLSRIQLFAMVGGNEARNPFTVTETYVKRAGKWQLAALAFTRRLTPQ
jgi:hypothetical protein